MLSCNLRDSLILGGWSVGMVWERVESYARMRPGRTEWRAAICLGVGPKHAVD